MKKIKIENNKIIRIVDFDEIKLKLSRDKETELLNNDVSDVIINLIKNKQESLITYSDKIKLKKREEIELKYKELLEEYENYKELIVIPYEDKYDKNIEILKSNFKELDNVVQQYFVPVLSEDKIKRNIDKNLKILSDTDYIVIKSYEAKLSMSDAPYTQEYLDEILTKRQAARDKINELESLIK